MEYLAKRLSTLLVMLDSRQALMRLPEPLLRQLLACEAVDVEQVGTLLLSASLCHCLVVWGGAVFIVCAVEAAAGF